MYFASQEGAQDLYTSLQILQSNWILSLGEGLTVRNITPTFEKYWQMGKLVSFRDTDSQISLRYDSVEGEKQSPYPRRIQ